VASNGTQFKRQTDLKRSSGLRLSTPIRSLVERVATEASITYSDALRLLVEEALAARAGRQSEVERRVDVLSFAIGSWGKDHTEKIDAILERITRAEREILDNLRGQNQALSTIEQTALVRVEKKLDEIGSWLQAQATPGVFLVALEEQAQKIDAMQWQIEKALDLLAEKEVDPHHNSLRGL
jgi:hypothetical protein